MSIEIRKSEINDLKKVNELLTKLIRYEKQYKWGMYYK